MVPSVATTASDLFYGRIQVQWRLPPLGIGVWRQGKVVHRIRALKGVRTEIELALSFLGLDAVKRIARKAARYRPRVARVLTSQKASADVGEKKRQPHKTELCHALVTSKMFARFTSIAIAIPPSGNSAAWWKTRNCPRLTRKIIDKHFMRRA
jgi:hypothetical protein